MAEVDDEQFVPAQRTLRGDKRIDRWALELRVFEFVPEAFSDTFCIELQVVACDVLANLLDIEGQQEAYRSS